jgi:nicotinamidase-related amidase
MALLIIDVQQGLVEKSGFGIDYVRRVRQAIDAARAANIVPIYLRMAFRPGAPEVGPSNRMLYGFARSGFVMESAESAKIHTLVTPETTDIVIDRRRANAFHGSELEVILRAHNITDLVLSGNATRMGVLATFFDAADRDYGLTVLSDCCADSDPEVHSALMAKVFPLQATVLTLAAWLTSLDPG